MKKCQCELCREKEASKALRQYGWGYQQDRQPQHTNPPPKKP